MNVRLFSNCTISVVYLIWCYDIGKVTFHIINVPALLQLMILNIVSLVGVYWEILVCYMMYRLISYCFIYQVLITHSHKANSKLIHFQLQWFLENNFAIYQLLRNKNISFYYKWAAKCFITPFLPHVTIWSQRIKPILLTSLWRWYRSALDSRNAN